LYINFTNKVDIITFIYCFLLSLFMIFVSTACLKGSDSRFTRNLSYVLDIYKRLGIKNIELGSVHEKINDFTPLFRYKKENNANFIIHGFFPPTDAKFMMNLASQNSRILKGTIAIAKNGIEMCNKLDSNLYSMHAGHCADVFVNQSKCKKIISADKAIEISANSLGILCDYAKKLDVKIAVENSNGFTENTFNYSIESFNEIFRKVSSRNLGVLIDIGHLNMAAKHFGFDKKDFIKKLQSKVLELHCHENHGMKDEHLNVKNKDLLNSFDKDVLKKIAVTLEANWLDENGIKEGKLILEKIIT